jgi:3-oxocholest-4-en-26-oyl-CoA dehydrogenase alpha subunit
MNFWKLETVEDEEFALEVTEFFEANYPASFRENRFERHFDEEFHKKIVQWKREHFENPTAGQRAAFKRVAARFDLEDIGSSKMVQQVISLVGTDAQKDLYIPLMESGQIRCSLGYTEPDSGSDVASAKTRAVRDGNEWVINGQKMFTTGADINTHVFLLTRTSVGEDKHKGLTMFIVPLTAPGVEVHPLKTLGHSHPTTMTFYSDVRVSDDARIGETDEGMGVLRVALDIEHGAGVHGSGGKRGPKTGPAPAVEKMAPRLAADASQTSTGSGQLASILARTAEWALNTRRSDGTREMDDVITRERLARIAVESEVARLLTRRNDASAPGVGNGAKLYWTEAYVRASEECLNIAGAEGLLPFTEESAAAGGWMEFAFRDSPVKTIVAGCSEVHRDVISQRRLGLPRRRS